MVTRTRWAAAALVAVGCLTGSATAVSIDVSRTYQTIDGFGFFGGRMSWYGSANVSDFYSQPWLDLTIDTLGITIWRNEYYSEEANQDANWAKQRPAVQALKAKADASNNPLKFIFSVWSPPSAMKCDGSQEDGCWGDPTGNLHPEGLKNGGTLCTSRHTDFANWLVTGIRNYADIGIDLYALSLQNEPLFCEFYNSCFYGYDYYTSVLSDVGPIVKAAYPNVKFFGVEHMLSANMYQGVSQFEYIYESLIKRTPQALPYMDIWAYHGYSNGVSPIPGAEMAQLWSLVRDSLAGTHKPIWQTEISGYNTTWGAGGAQELASAMFSALQYGNVAGWVYWYGADDAGDGGLLDASFHLNKCGYVSKHFSRYLRPGAVRVDVGATGNANVFVAAFRHAQLNNFVVLALNSGTSSFTLPLSGTGVPSQFTMYRTSASENCVGLGTVNASSITLAPGSINTLVNGSVYEPATGVTGRASGRPSQARLTQARRVYSLDGRQLRLRQSTPTSTSGVFLVASDRGQGCRLVMGPR
jgi:glucuronoarabinoxylan endo-1,4-beta-xylanase